MRILVCGGRNYRNADVLNLTLLSFGIPEEIITGGASGADAMAEAWAIRKGIPVKVFKAEWSRHGKAAGPIRNQKMIDEAQPDVVVAFPGGKGTDDMVSRAIKSGISVIKSMDWSADDAN